MYRHPTYDNIDWYDNQDEEMWDEGEEKKLDTEIMQEDDEYPYDAFEEYVESVQGEFDPSDKQKFQEFLAHAIQNNDISQLKTWYNNYPYLFESRDPKWMEAAVSKGTREVVEFFHQMVGCSLQYTACLSVFLHSNIHNMCSYAAAHNNLEALRYLIDNRCTMDGTITLACIQHDEEKGLRCIEYLVEEKDVPLHPSFCEHVVEFGYVLMLQFGHKHHNVTFGKNLYKTACQFNKVKCMEYLYEQNLLWDPSVIHAAALNGSIDCMRFLHEHGCPLATDMFKTILNCTQETAFECFRYAHQKGCEWGRLTVESAAREGKIKFMLYAALNGCPFLIHQMYAQLHHYEQSQVQEMFRPTNEFQHLYQEEQFDSLQMRIHLVQFYYRFILVSEYEEENPTQFTLQVKKIIQELHDLQETVKNSLTNYLSIDVLEHVVYNYLI